MRKITGHKSQVTSHKEKLKIRILTFALRTCALARLCTCVIVLLFLVPCTLHAASIVNSKHNLSAGGPGVVKGVTESEICIFCHTSHNATSEAPLWNRYESGKVYIPYTSSTLKAVVGQPTGASKVCLSCHDGTVALGMVRSRTEAISFTQAIGGEQNLGTDLSNDHPISFLYDSSLVFSNSQLKYPSLLTGAIRLDKDSQLQCTACHDPHNNQFGCFSKVDGVRGALCLACHNMNGWDGSIHKLSIVSWNGLSSNPWQHSSWSNVSDNACENCHTPHNAAGKKRLLNSSTEEGNCIPCHNGNVAQKNIVSEFNKSSLHPIYNYTAVHDSAENTIVSSNRHVECFDCHNAHAVSNIATGLVDGALTGVKGVNAQGLAVNTINYEYELCFRCHADSNYAARNYVNRQFAENNTRIEFAPSNQSYHPLENIGRNINVPSLISPLTTSSIIKCSDCHNNNTGPGNGGTGPKGPHGSIYSPLLERNLNFADNQSENDTAYALCYKCHSKASILSNNSFKEHNMHIKEEMSPCTACHDPHGVKNSPFLINFDRNIVSANSSGVISFAKNADGKWACSLRCHNKEHNNEDY